MTSSTPTDHPPGSDEDLVERVRGGSQEAYAALWERHASAGHVAARRVTAAFDPDDLVQEAFVRILAATRAGRGPTGPFRPYLYRTIRSIATTWGQATRATPVDELPEVVDPRDLADTVLEGGLMARAFVRLPQRWQAVLWYTEVEGMAPREVAPLLGLPAGAVSALAYRAREGLRREWLQVHVNEEPVAPGCRWTVERLADHHRDALSPAARGRVREHLSGCVSCTLLAAEIADAGARLRVLLVPLVLGVPALLDGAAATGSAIGSATAGQVGGPPPMVDGAPMLDGTPAAVPGGPAVPGDPAAGGSAGLGPGGSPDAVVPGPGGVPDAAAAGPAGLLDTAPAGPAASSGSGGSPGSGGEAGASGAPGAGGAAAGPGPLVAGIAAAVVVVVTGVLALAQPWAGPDPVAASSDAQGSPGATPGPVPGALPDESTSDEDAPDEDVPDDTPVAGDTPDSSGSDEGSAGPGPDGRTPPDASGPPRPGGADDAPRPGLPGTPGPAPDAADPGPVEPGPTEPTEPPEPTDPPTRPAAPTVTGPPPGSLVYLPELVGTGAPGARLDVLDGGGAVVTTTTVGTDGRWRATPSGVDGQGQTSLRVRQRVPHDEGDLVSPASDAVGPYRFERPQVLSPTTGETVRPTLTGAVRVVLDGRPGLVVQALVDGNATGNVHRPGLLPLVLTAHGLAPGEHTVGVRYLDEATGAVGPTVEVRFTVAQG